MSNKGLGFAAFLAMFLFACSPQGDVVESKTDNPAAIESIVATESLIPTTSTTDTKPLSPPVETKVNDISDEGKVAATPYDSPSVSYSGVVYKITQTTHPKLYEAWGKEWIENINRIMPLAVAKTADQSKCDSPATVELSDTRSLVRKQVVFYVDCMNGERFYMTQLELTDPKSLVAENDVLNESPSAYTLACQELAKTKIENPASFKPDRQNTESKKGSSGNMVVKLPFTFTDTTDSEVSMVSRCAFSTTGATDFTVTKT